MLLRKRDSRESMLGETLMPGDDPEYDRRISRVKYLLLLFFYFHIFTTLYQPWICIFFYLL